LSLSFVISEDLSERYRFAAVLVLQKRLEEYTIIVEKQATKSLEILTGTFGTSCSFFLPEIISMLYSFVFPGATNQRIDFIFKLDFKMCTLFSYV